MAEYHHNSCSKCPPFAHTHARRRPHHSSIALSMMVWSMPYQPCRKRCFSSQPCLSKIVCYLQRIFNRNRKLKQQVSKLISALKLGVCSKVNLNIFVCIFSRYAKTWTSSFHKVVRQHTEGVMGSIIRVLLEIYLSFQQWNNFENPLRIENVIAMSLVYYFFGDTV